MLGRFMNASIDNTHATNSADAKMQTAYATNADTRTIWNHCAANCGGRCALRFTIENGRATSVGSCAAETPDGVPLPQACVRGRRMLAWAESPLRLKWPFKRTGPRGSGLYERISWDEAIGIACDKLRDVIDRFGNDAVFIAYGTNANCTTARPFNRLMNCLGGYLSRYNDYSCAQATWAARYCYGMEPDDGSSFSQAFSADLVIAFGANPVVANDGGANVGAQWRRLVKQAGTRVVVIDPRKSESVMGNAEWLPITPGTDAALVAALAHELIHNNAVDLDFLHKYCIGFDEQTMPKAFRGKHMSYRDYVAGEGYDRIEKTPEWAESICGIPADRIRSLACSIAGAQRLHVLSGWGPQRRSNGEWSAWAAMALPCLVGQVGLEGTSNGLYPWHGRVLSSSIPEGRNPVAASIPVFETLHAIKHGEEMTAENAGVRGANRLRHGIKYLINYAGNSLTNQHSDVRHSHEVLADETACEFILGIDTVMTDSLKYADVIFPDLLRFEQQSQTSGGADWGHIVTGRPVPTPRDEQKSAYEMACLMAARLGVEQEFTLGRTEGDWIRALYDETRESQPELGLPEYEQAERAGIVNVWRGPRIALEQFRESPADHPLATASGKIELFSEQLLRDTAGWRLREEDTLACLDTLAPLPAYIPEWTGAGIPNAERPLRLTGFHGRARIHSSWGFDEKLKSTFPQVVYLNERDAAKRGIADGNEVFVENDRGTLRLPAKVTGDIAEGTAAIAQGAWYDARAEGGHEVDFGGNINTLAVYRPSPLAKGNPQHTNICQVRKAQA